MPMLWLRPSARLALLDGSTAHLRRAHLRVSASACSCAHCAPVEALAGSEPRRRASVAVPPAPACAIRRRLAEKFLPASLHLLLFGRLLHQLGVDVDLHFVAHQHAGALLERLV